jgi:hypothetical protein
MSLYLPKIGRHSLTPVAVATAIPLWRRPIRRIFDGNRTMNPTSPMKEYIPTETSVENADNFTLQFFKLFNTRIKDLWCMADTMPMIFDLWALNARDWNLPDSHCFLRLWFLALMTKYDIRELSISHDSWDVKKFTNMKSKSERVFEFKV